MLKLFGSIVTIGAAALLGVYGAAELEASYQETLYLNHLIGMLRGEIRYTRSVLSQIFLKLSKELKSPYDAWFRQMCLRMESRKGGSFGEIWEESLKMYLKDLKLPGKEKRRLAELGMLLGNADIEMQVSHLQNYQEQLALSIQDTRAEIQNKKKLCCCVGVTGGIFLAVLLI